MIPFPLETARQYPSVLICAPTYEGKNYCFEQWLRNVNRFTYPKNRVSLFLPDNSRTNENALMLSKKYGIKSHWRDYGDMHAFDRLAYGHEECRKYAIDKGFDYMLHLETDVFPPPDVIERLLSARMPVVSGWYCIGQGSTRVPMVFYRELGALHGAKYETASLFSPNETALFFDEDENFNLKPCTNPGLGCTLIAKEILAQVEFRHPEGAEAAPDSFFASDLLALNIPWHVDIDLQCYHFNNDDWGKHVMLMDYNKNNK